VQHNPLVMLRLIKYPMRDSQGYKFGSPYGYYYRYGFKLPISYGLPGLGNEQLVHGCLGSSTGVTISSVHDITVAANNSIINTRFIVCLF
jgi:hypothetical protein